MARVAMPALDLTVIPGGRGRGPGVVQVPRHQLAERESEGIAAMALLLGQLDRAIGMERAKAVVSIAVVLELQDARALVCDYLHACRERAELIDPPRRPAA